MPEVFVGRSDAQVEEASDDEEEERIADKYYTSRQPTLALQFGPCLPR